MILSNRKGTFQLLIIMILVSLLVTGISIFIVYRVVLNEKKDYLKELSENQVSIIKSIYAEGKNADEILHVLKRQQKINNTIGKTGEFVIGYQKNDSIFFLLDHLKYDYANPKPIAIKSELAEPMKFALSNKSGIIRGLDYSRDEVLAYCNYIPELHWGIVTKIDVAEVNEPFFKAGIIASLIAIVLVVLATIIFKRISDPIVQKIIESEENFRAILDATQESVYLFNKKGIILAANITAAARLKLSREDIIGHPFSEFISPELASMRQHYLDNVFESGVPLQFEDIRNGIIFEHHFFPFIRNNKVIYVASFSRDITEQKNAYEMLRQSEQRLKHHFENSPLAIIEWDANFMVTKWSKEAERIFGWTAEDTIGKPISSLNMVYEEDIPIVNHTMERLTSGKENTVISANRNYTKSGSIIECTWYNSILFNEYGKMESVMSLIEDITERKQVEKALQQSEEQYRKLVEISPYAVFINRNNKITYVNPTAIKLFGASTSDQLLGKTPFDIFHPGAHSIVKERIDKVLAGKSVPIIELKIVQIDGTEKDVEVTGSKFSDHEGDAIQVILRDITESKQAQAIKARYQLITEYARDPLLLVALDGQIVEANHAAEEFYGYSYEELMSLKIHNLRLDKDGLINSQIVQAKHKGILFETIHIRKDGTIIPVEVSSRGVTIEGQEMILSVIRDITERKKTEQALVEQAKMLEQAPVFVRDLNDAIIMWTDGMEKIYGFNNAEALGKISHELLQTKFPEPLQEIFTKLHKNGKWEGELQHKQKNGQPAVVLSSWMLHHNGQGNPIAIIEVNKDITKRKKAENDLQESEEKLKLALDNGSIGVWVWNMVTNEIEWDERMERMFGLEPGSFGKSYDAFEAFLLDEDIPHVRNAIKKAMEKDIPFETIYRIKLDHENQKYISAKALVKKDQEGKPIKMTGVCFDITEVKKNAEQVLFKLNEELLRSNKELEQFAYVASHDLQEPLRMVSSFTQLLAKRYGNKLDQDAKEFIQFAVDGASRMQTLINDLLTFSRIQTKGKEFSNVSLHDILGKVLYNLSLPIQEKKALVTNDELPTIFADEGQMVQLLQNLVGNAIKFSKKNPLVHISATDENDQFIVSIKDNGIGIEKQYFGRIFQIFQRLQAKDEYEGTGIGLAICKRIVERHGGKIWLESEPGVGTTFYFTIQKTERN